MDTLKVFGLTGIEARLAKAVPTILIRKPQRVVSLVSSPVVDRCIRLSNTISIWQFVRFGEGGLMAIKTRKCAEKYRGMMKIGEAADFMGVSSETLRNWDRWGWLKPVRNPVTGYRYYLRENLETYRDQIIRSRGSSENA